MMLNIQVLVLGHVQKSGVVKQDNEVKILPSLDNWIPNGNTHLSKRYKNTAHIRLFSRRPHTITKMKDNMESTIAESFNGYS